MGKDQRYSVRLSKQARKDLDVQISSGLKDKILAMLDMLQEDPFRSPPPFEKMRGDLKRYYSRRLNSEHRVVYEVLPDDTGEFSGVVVIARMRTHYRGIIPAIFL
ncbi:MAG: Txe/YoeB family addiction module toxin [Candidatus Methanoplasma sp.]|jgi:Txe/YoeB family toxin of toxin-antitoxin system|nr:Txe/YoeB family addiction module toxin [Candidatus Methanoplasma sp.]